MDSVYLAQRIVNNGRLETVNKVSDPGIFLGPRLHNFFCQGSAGSDRGQLSGKILEQPSLPHG